MNAFNLNVHFLLNNSFWFPLLIFSILFRLFRAHGLTVTPVQWIISVVSLNDQRLKRSRYEIENVRKKKMTTEEVQLNEDECSDTKLLLNDPTRGKKISSRNSIKIKMQKSILGALSRAILNNISKIMMLNMITCIDSVFIMDFGAYMSSFCKYISLTAFMRLDWVMCRFYELMMNTKQNFVQIDAIVHSNAMNDSLMK